MQKIKQKNSQGDNQMTYNWDNKKPTAQMLGRWQPFHDGHYTLFKEIIKTGQGVYSNKRCSRCR